MKDDTVKKREKVWGLVTKKILDVLHPLILATNSDQRPLLDIPTEVEGKLSGIRQIDEPMKDMRPMDSSTLNHAIKAYAQCRSEKKNDFLLWAKPLEINFLQMIHDRHVAATRH